MKPEFSKPFNLVHARAGAPFCGVNGEAVRVLMWDRKNDTYPILAIEEHGEQEPVTFRTDGQNKTLAALGRVRQLVMLPLGMIEGKPVFVGDEFLWRGGDQIRATPDMAGGDWSMSRWPALEQAYPESRLSEDEIKSAACQTRGSVVQKAYAIANAALRHALDAGQVVRPTPPVEAREVRDMRIAKAVLAEFTDAVRDGVPLHVIDLPAIIEKIK